MLPGRLNFCDIGRCGSYRTKFESQLERNRARLREERVARERCQVDAAQAKSQLQTVETDRRQLAAQLEAAMATIAELRQLQPTTQLPVPLEGVPPAHRGASAQHVHGQQQQHNIGTAATAGLHFASPGLRYI